MAVISPFISEKTENTGNDGDKVELNITGNIDFSLENDNLVLKITSNVVDGSLFETVVMDNKLNTKSHVIEIKDGIGEKEFDIHENWDVGYLAATAMMRFNLDDYPQPEHVKQLYGEYGEKLQGDLAIENNLGGKNINFESIAIAYPDEETVKNKQSEIFADALNQLIDVSNGVILRIQPSVTIKDWSSVAVIVGDFWYYSAEHEKERFAEQISQTIKTIIYNSGIVSKDKVISVYFYDAYKKELASPKALGGYKIKR